ncbi:nitrate- and nitrite sensing domain-containing protein [Kitasatospora sp. NBC_01287]|uniref:nitrate- and nitrite sensing domain-containing protein n=1 Tax=Kitasatospora sp. NBC_01287 TaxID=2903573 RepID=UPI00224F833A|nr:nitrate- and nitrite sensing domain-containing protein [Kitasatospora sp. NBC_01287]MCX4746617.1 nitrate- and nitrite sensing domain-containing protein [Kitasatospora sp. NBC_01287]
MRRKQPVTPQRRSEPRETDRSGQSTAGFSPFAANTERPPLANSGAPGRPAGSGPEVISAGGDDRPTGTSRYEFLAFRNWRVPVRLVAIMLIPVTIALVFGGMRVNTSFDDYVKASRAEQTAKLAQAATNLADALENERDLTLAPLLTGQDPNGTVAQLRSATDQKLAAYRTAYAKVSGDPEIAQDDYAFENNVASLASLRTNAYSVHLFASATGNAYSTLIDPLLSIDSSVGAGSAAGVNRGRAIYNMSQTKAYASAQRAQMLMLLVGIAAERTTKYENTQLIQDLLVASSIEQNSLSAFQNGASADDSHVYANALVTQATADTHLPLRMPDKTSLPTMNGLMNIGLAYQAAAQAGMSDGQDVAAAAAADAKAAGLTPENWVQATASEIGPLRATETQLLGSVVGDAVTAKDGAQTDAILNASIVIASLVLAGLLTGFIARSMILGMRVLNTSALEIANTRLPDLVEKLSKTDPDRVDTNVEAIALWGRDEIGEVARAFDQVHRQAVALAAEQALLRGNLNAIFSNLSRRSQGLIQRQLALITDLENNEADPDQLENLFKLDHLATRMRRNGENLLVLAGEEPGRRWNTPVPLVDVLRAAASEVEQYERIELSGIPEAEVIGAAVTDLVHLLAELLENATSFSSPQTRVNVNATRLPDGRVLVEIHDKGIGLTAEDFAEINEKLAEPPTVDASISRRMGLFVVGRLSDRHDIRVQLRPSGESAGTTSLVMLPAALTQMRAMPEPEEEFTVSRIFAEQEPQPSWGQEAFAAPRSAAELGFDDNLALGGGAGGFSPALDSMQRSLRLDERRRAALEAGPDEHGELSGESPFGQQDFNAQEFNAQEFGQQDFNAPEFAEAGPGAGDPDYVEAEFVEAETEYEQPATYAQQGYPAQNHEQGGYQGYYGDQQYAEPGYQQPYEDYGQQGYEQGGYYTDQNAQQPYEYQDGGYQDGGYQGNGYQQPAAYQPAPTGFDGFAPRDQRGQETAAGHPYEAPALPAAAPAPSLDSGLPLRRPGQQLAGGLGARSIGDLDSGEQPNWFTGAKDTSGTEEVDARGHQVSGLGSSGPTGPTGPTGQAAWQSANDGAWQRAEQVREPAAGGVTGSGLPRRVPRQNLVPGNAKPAASEGPQVSRSPEEVRGRLTNLRRGVEQGRNAGADGQTGSFRIDHQDMSQPDRPGRGQQNDSTDLFGGSNHQER